MIHQAAKCGGRLWVFSRNIWRAVNSDTVTSTVRSTMGSFVDRFSVVTEPYHSIIGRQRLGVVFSEMRNTRHVYYRLKLAFIFGMCWSVRENSKLSRMYANGKKQGFACINTYQSTDEPQVLENVVASLYLTEVM